jgi:hypothetical protein
VGGDVDDDDDDLFWAASCAGCLGDGDNLRILASLSEFNSAGGANVDFPFTVRWKEGEEGARECATMAAIAGWGVEACHMDCPSPCRSLGVEPRPRSESFRKLNDSCIDSGTGKLEGEGDSEEFFVYGWNVVEWLLIDATEFLIGPANDTWPVAIAVCAFFKNGEREGREGITRGELDVEVGELLPTLNNAALACPGEEIKPSPERWSPEGLVS